jgi:hypothetical protein
MLKRQQNIIYFLVLLVGLFLHILLWDTDFLSRIGRATESWSGFMALTGTIWDWFMIYIIRGVGIWMLMLAILLLFVILPILVRYRHLNIKPSPWLAINVSVYFFLIMKLLRIY